MESILLSLIVFAAMLVIAFCLPDDAANKPMPQEENRPAPIGLIAANEDARIASLKRVAARANHAQRQRDASARLTRGW